MSVTKPVSRANTDISVLFATQTGEKFTTFLILKTKPGLSKVTLSLGEMA